MTALPIRKAYHSLDLWLRSHTGCPCTRFSDFSVARGERLLSKIEKILCEGLSPPRSLPPVVWKNDADVDCLAACQVKPGTDSIVLAKGSCVNWTTTLVAYVHAVSHVLNDDGDVTKTRHRIEWQIAVDTICRLLTDRETGLDGKHFSCIRDSLRLLKYGPRMAEHKMSAPSFLTQLQSDHKWVCYFAVASAVEKETNQRRQDASRGTVRWRFQDEFDSVDAAMQLHGRVEPGSVVELALRLKRDHDPRCKCYDSEAFTPGEGKTLIECLVNEVLPMQLPRCFRDEPIVRCTLSTKSSKACVLDEGFLHLNLNRLESFADAMRVVVREWARRLVKTGYNITENFQRDEKYLRAVAGISTWLIQAHPFEGLLSNWFPTEACVRLALTPAPIWPNSMIPLMRVNQQGASRVLGERTFQHLSPDELDDARERSIIVRESAMHPGLEGTSDFKDYEDFLVIRGPVMRRSFRRPTDNCTYEFRVRSVRLDVMTTISVQGDVTVVEMTDSAVNLVSRSGGVPDDPSLYEVLFNDESIDETECAAKVAENGFQIRVEPIMRQVRVLKGWTEEVVLDIEAPSTITARHLLELMGITNPDTACIVQRDYHVLFSMDTVDTQARLRVFEEGYVHLLACVNVGPEEIRDSIVVEACRANEPLELHLARWRWTYGIRGEVECEGRPVLSSTTVRGVARHNPLRVHPFLEPTEQDIPVHKIAVQLTGGKELRPIKLKSHHTLEKAFQMLCKMTGMLAQSAQLTTCEGFPVEPRQRMYSLGLNSDSARLVLTRKPPPNPKRRKRTGTVQSTKHGSPEKRRAGKFAHPRPSVAYVVISSDSEEDTVG